MKAPITLVPTEALQPVFVLEHLKSTLTFMQNTWEVFKGLCRLLQVVFAKMMRMNTPVKCFLWLQFYQDHPLATERMDL